MLKLRPAEVAYHKVLKRYDNVDFPDRLDAQRELIRVRLGLKRDDQYTLELGQQITDLISFSPEKIS